MPRLVAFGKDAVHDLDHFDTVDLEAIQLAHAWGVSTNGHKERGWTFSRCPREHCGGAIIDAWGNCMLCGRPGASTHLTA
jgi:hypothetical protein